MYQILPCFFCKRGCSKAKGLISDLILFISGECRIACLIDPECVLVSMKSLLDAKISSGSAVECSLYYSYTYAGDLQSDNTAITLYKPSITTFFLINYYLLFHPFRPQAHYRFFRAISGCVLWLEYFLLY